MIRDQGAQELSLDNDYGTTRGPNAPDTLELSLYDGDPTVDGDEIPTQSLDDDSVLVDNGYERVTFSNDDWLPAAGGVKVSLQITMPVTTEEWPTVTHWALRDPATDLWWDSARLAEPLEVTGPGTSPLITLAVYYTENLEGDD